MKPISKPNNILGSKMKLKMISLLEEKSKDVIAFAVSAHRGQKYGKAPSLRSEKTSLRYCIRNLGSLCPI